MGSQQSAKATPVVDVHTPVLALLRANYVTANPLSFSDLSRGLNVRFWA